MKRYGSKAERILGNSDFVEAVLKEADEQLERRYRLKAEGFDLDRVAERVATVMNIPIERVWEKNRRPQVAEARSLLCFWPSTELAMSMTELAKRLNLTQPAVIIAVRRGEKIARENRYRLADGYLFIYLWTSLFFGSQTFDYQATPRFYSHNREMER